MKKRLTVVTILCWMLFLMSSCDQQKSQSAVPQQAVQSENEYAGHDYSKDAKDRIPQAVGPAGWTGTVVETMDTAGYTYVKVDTGKETIWAAAPEIEVKVGDKVSVPPGAPMKNYHSKTLDRTFEVVYFVGSINKPGAAPPAGQQSMGMHGMQKSPPAPKIDLSGIARAAGGKTIAEIFAEKAALSGKTVAVRGKVVKFNPNIMGVNWMHVQDGSGAAGTNDLTVTSAAMARVGDTVLVTGVVILDKDLGSGYKFDVIIENAKVTVEK
ncbi:MAG: hypothetical protein GY868_01225 [Deltaproteobacteria bacterium]|nr:hypothetical protein [Deltaproteobacteria bacterium]